MLYTDITPDQNAEVIERRLEARKVVENYRELDAKTPITVQDLTDIDKLLGYIRWDGPSRDLQTLDNATRALRQAFLLAEEEGHQLNLGDLADYEIAISGLLDEQLRWILLSQLNSHRFADR